jgi:hypothetical protein
MSSETASVSLSSSLPTTELSLVDGSFTEVARGVKWLVAEGLTPGIYELRAAAGPAATSRLLRLQPGQRFEDHIELAFPSAAPIPGTTTWNEEHAVVVSRHSELLVRESEMLTDHKDRAVGGLIVVARALSDSSAADPQREFTVVSPDGEAMHTEEGPDWRVQSAVAAPGGHVLHAVRDGVALAQALWVQPGWQTLVFVSAGPRGPNLAKASIWMCPMHVPWYPWDEYGGAAYELALWGLRDGRTVLPPDFLDVLLYGKFENPMFGILGAHALLLEPNIDFERFDVVMGNLDQLLPGAPDVAALWALGEDARLRQHGPQRATAPADWLVGWPPMLTAGFLAALRHDARQRGRVIAEGSEAERIGARLTAAGVWTIWTTEPASGTERARSGGPQAMPSGSPVADALRAIDVPDAETGRVADYLATIADVRDDASVSDLIGDLGATHVATATNLSYRTVTSALAELEHRA